MTSFHRIAFTLINLHSNLNKISVTISIIWELGMIIGRTLEIYQFKSYSMKKGSLSQIILSLLLQHSPQEVSASESEANYLSRNIFCIDRIFFSNSIDFWQFAILCRRHKIDSNRQYQLCFHFVFSVKVYFDSMVSFCKF